MKDNFTTALSYLNRPVVFWLLCPAMIALAVLARIKSQGGHIVVLLRDSETWTVLGIAIVLVLAAGQVPALMRAVRRQALDESSKLGTNIQRTSSGRAQPRLRDLLITMVCFYVLPPLAVFSGSFYLCILGIAIITAAGVSGRRQHAGVPR